MHPLWPHRLKMEGSHQMKVYVYITRDTIRWPGIENESTVVQGVVLQL